MNQTCVGFVLGALAATVIAGAAISAAPKDIKISVVTKVSCDSDHKFFRWTDLVVFELAQISVVHAQLWGQTFDPQAGS